MSDNHSMFAIFRGHPHEDLAKIGEQHMQNDLQPQDRERLRTAAGKVSTHTTIGSILGLGLGLALAYRIRANRLSLYNAFRVVARPTELVFANGRREPIPDLEPYIRPTFWGDAATYTGLSLGGLFLGGECGFLTGTASASNTIMKDPESRRRIEDAFRLFQVDLLKKQLSSLEATIQDSSPSSWDKLKGQASGLANSLRSSSSSES
ncbi:hypothetical protein B0H66DRAFT_547214 [Apodospora peruviana]|uniref:Uncharacterized protein n=1 Tax=Apodospora peruviana TaxID=516989 RepID=A0AAE0IH82_9PEZI|nr:hypothetical protein B0H66DRAFT_547214 [Apodospora peruviana]